jgi:hypothetical protein
MLTVRRTLLSLAASLALSVAAGAAIAAPTVSTLGGDTQVALSATFVQALTSLGVAPSPSFPARLRHGTATFPIPTGEIDLGTLKGEIAHNGGLNLDAGGTRVNISSFQIDTTGAAPAITGLVKVNDALIGRIALFDLQLTAAPTVRRYALYGTLQLKDVGVTLSAEAAEALNGVFGVTAFAAGLPVGTARSNTFFYDPDA